MLSANWRVYSEALGYQRFLELVRTTIAKMPQNIPIIFLGPSIQYEESLPQLLASLALRGADLSDLPQLVKPKLFELDDRMKADLGATPNVTYVSILTANCPDRKCPVLLGKIPLQWDAVHLTVPGSQRVIAAALPQMTSTLFGN
jgi:hypothetical protein